MSWCQAQCLSQACIRQLVSLGMSKIFFFFFLSKTFKDSNPESTFSEIEVVDGNK